MRREFWRAANLGRSRLLGGYSRLKAGCGQNCPPHIAASRKRLEEAAWEAAAGWEPAPQNWGVVAQAVIS